jgi:predicted P-loop ATPase/GTPase
MNIRNNLIKEIKVKKSIYRIIAVEPFKLLLVCRLCDPARVWKTNDDDIGRIVLVVNYFKTPVIRIAGVNNMILSEFKAVMQEINKYLKGQNNGK